MPHRVGLLGGTFDPVHVGHLVAAEEARAALALDEVMFVPAAEPPHKPGRPITPARHRLAMLELAVEDHSGFSVSRIDVDRAGPHYTVDLLRLARDQLRPGTELFFLMGMDSLSELATWRDPETIIRLARPVVVDRPGYEADLAALEKAVPGVTERVAFVTMPLIGISGTDLRRRVAAGSPIRYQVPAAVERYVRRHRLYLETADDTGTE
jgi:nicotinate-nucleotide adenylyltransferase